MLALRIKTNNATEELNDKYAYKVYEALKDVCKNIVITYISDSLGTTFFIRTKNNREVYACDYGTAIILLHNMVISLYPQDTTPYLLEVLD